MAEGAVEVEVRQRAVPMLSYQDVGAAVEWLPTIRRGPIGHAAFSR